MTRLFLFFTLMIMHGITGQIIKVDTADYPRRKAFLTDYSEKSKIFNKTLKKYGSSENRQLGKIFSGFQKSLEENVKDRVYLFEPLFINFINDKIKFVEDKNPGIATNFSVLVAKDYEPNAYNFGENTIIVNLGLFLALENEEELTSILCHEIAHAKLEHTVKSILAKIKSDEQKKGEVSMLKNDPNQHDKAFDMFKTILYSNMKERRINEIKADSLGFEYYKNLGFQKKSFVDALQRLKQNDDKKPDSVFAETYRKVFSTPNQKFKEEWLKMEDFSGYNYKLLTNKISEDSLKTHPQIDLRINLLRQKLTPAESVEDIKPAESAFTSLKKAALSRVLPNYYDTEKYGEGTYYCLIMLQKNPNDKFAANYIGQFFRKIYDARKSYTLNRYLDKINPKEQSLSYQQFLSFMWNLNLDEIKNIADFYQKSVS